MQVFSYKAPLTFKHITFDELTCDHEGIYLRSKGDYEICYERAPLFLDDPDQCNLFSALNDQNYHYPHPFIISKQDIKVIGVRTILDQQGNWFNDRNYIYNDLNLDLSRICQYEDKFLNEWTGFYPTDRPETFIFKQENRKEKTLPGKTLVACSLEPGTYGSWIFRILPKLATAKRLGLVFDRVLIEAGNPRLREYLNLIGFDHTKIEEHDRNIIYHLECALIPSLQNSYAYLDKETQSFYAHLRATFGRPCSGEKIYVSRYHHSQRGYTTRVLQNESKLIKSLAKKGFKIIQPELLSVKEQIETFSSASIVVGPSGSGMFNTAFCHPHTKVIDIESESHWIHAHTSFFSSLVLDFGIFVGRVDPTDPEPVHKRWSVNIPALLSRIGSMTEDGNSSTSRWKQSSLAKLARKICPSIF